MRAQPDQQSEGEPDAAEQELQGEHHRTQLAGTILIALAPCDLPHRGLVEAEIEQRRECRKRGIETDQAVALAAEHAEIDDVEDQRKNQPGAGAGKIGDDIESLTIDHYRSLRAPVGRYANLKHQLM